MPIGLSEFVIAELSWDIDPVASRMITSCAADPQLMTRAIDLVVVAAYLTFMAGLGIWFSRRQTSTESYFVAKRSIPFWAMGMSMLATMISSVTFVAYPGASYAKDWSLLVPGFLLIAILPFIGRVIIPFYREEVGMSAYEYF